MHRTKRLKKKSGVSWEVKSVPGHLKKYFQSTIEGRQEEPPPPVIDLDGYERFIVDDILDHRRRGGELQDLVRWKGYFDATWEPESNLKNKIGQDLVPLALYKQRHPH